MRRYVPRVMVTAVAVAAGLPLTTTQAVAQEGGQSGGRYQVLVPTLAVQAGVDGRMGDRVSDELRKLIEGMATHTPVGERDMNRAMKQYKLEQLDEITARQLAQQMNAQLVAWGTVEPGASGLQADVRFIDVRSGDQIEVEDAAGADQKQLAAAIFAQFQTKVEGIRQAAFCNDYLSSQQFERALENCDQALAVVPRSTTALYGKATALLNLERYPEALATYEQLLEVDAAHQDALLGAGLAASRLNESDRAMGFYTRYMEVNPGNVDVRMTVANDIAKTGDYVSAFRMLEPAVTENASNADFQKYFFSIATAAGQKVQEEQGLDAARPFFEAAMRAYQTAYAGGSAELDASSLRQAIAVTAALGDQAQAMSLAREATTRFDTVAAIWSQYASVLNQAEQYGEEARALSRVIELDPNYDNVYIRRGYALLRSGQRNQAMADLERAATNGNRDQVAQVLYGMGGQAYQANRFGEAQELLTLANQYASGDVKSKTQFLLGVTYYRQGEAIAKANGQGRAAEAERALALFQRAVPLLQATSEAQAAQVLSAAQQYIENQQAIIQAARGR